MNDPIHADVLSFKEEAPNEFRLSRRAALFGGAGMLLTPVSSLLSPGLANSNVSEAARVENFLAGIPNMCRVATATVEGPYYIDQRIVRSDIRESQPGVPLQLDLRVVNANASCRPVSGAVVSIWHCNAEGEYSGYLFNDPNQIPNLSTVNERGHVEERDSERFLRGVQTTDADGKVTFRTIVPGWYTPRAAHIHVRVFLSATSMITTQLYFPQSLLNSIQSREDVYKVRGVSLYTNENDIVRRQSGVAGMEDILAISPKEDGSLYAMMTLAAGNI